MLERLSLIRNLGQFENVSDGKDLPFSNVTVLYAENGRGKTTIAAIFRALADAASGPVDERRRLGATHAPHIVVETNDGQPAAVLNGGVWSRSVGSFRVFDDVFVDANVYSGLEVESQHRKSLHDVVIGSTAVSLAQDLQRRIDEVAEHNRRLRVLEAAITPDMRGDLSIAAYVSMKPDSATETNLARAEQTLAAAKNARALEDAQIFEEIAVPRLDTERFARVLAKDLKGLDSETLANVADRFDTLGEGGEQWVSEGLVHLAHRSESPRADFCPLCEQDIASSPSIDAYRLFFSEAYENLKNEVQSLLAELDESHGEHAFGELQRSARLKSEREAYWERYINVESASFDVEDLVVAWRRAAESLRQLCLDKQRAPLEPLQLSETDSALVAEFERSCDALNDVRVAATTNNDAISALRASLIGADIAALQSSVDRLRVQKRRFDTNEVKACAAYSSELAAKKITEGLRDAKRTELDTHRAAAFPAYETRTNLYLQKFNAGFRIASFRPANTGSGSTCGYSVVINSTELPVSSAGTPGAPSFRTALSAGDRNTLALAFFFASLDLDDGLEDAVVVIDDPVSSLDEHRSLTTVEEIAGLRARCAQVVVLSHNKPFLASVWTSAPKDDRAAIEVTRTGTGSGLAPWDVSQEMVTEHDRRAVRLQNFDATAIGDRRELARDLRPHIEAYLRVACALNYPPGRLLGPFVETCRQRLAAANPILSQGDIDEVAAILVYANKYHHDTNPAYETELVNDQELQGFVRRVLRFCGR